MVKLRFDTDLGTTLKASADLAAAIDKVGKSMTNTAKEANALEKAAKKIVDQNLTPTEKYTQKLELMAKAVKANRMEMADAEKTAARLREQLDATAGPSTLARIAQMAAGYVSIGAAAATLVAGLKAVAEQSQVTADRVLNTIGAFGQLQQVATSDEDFLKLIGQARSLVGPVFGKEQAGMAADFVFALRNAQYTEEESKAIIEIGKSRQVKPEGMQQLAEGLKKAQDVFGKAEAGNLGQVTNKIFAAAGEMQTDFAKAALAVTGFGTQGMAIGATDEAQIAAFVAIEKQSENEAEASTRTANLFKQIAQEDMAKGTLQETLAPLIARVRGGEAPIKIMKESRAAAALGILAGVEGQAQFESQLALQEKANVTDMITGRRFFDLDPRLRAAGALSKLQGETEQKIEERNAERENIFDIVRESRRNKAAAGGMAEQLGAWFTNTIIGGAQEIAGTQNVEIQQAAKHPAMYGISAENQKLIVDYLKRISENTTNGTTPAPKAGRQE